MKRVSKVNGEKVKPNCFYCKHSYDYYNYQVYCRKDKREVVYPLIENNKYRFSAGANNCSLFEVDEKKYNKYLIGKIWN